MKRYFRDNFVCGNILRYLRAREYMGVYSRHSASREKLTPGKATSESRFWVCIDSANSTKLEEPMENLDMQYTYYTGYCSTFMFANANSNDCHERLHVQTSSEHYHGTCGGRSEQQKRRALEQDISRVVMVAMGGDGGGGGGGGAGGGGGGWWLPAPRTEGRNGEYGGAEVSGKLNLAQDVTAPGNTDAASVRADKKKAYLATCLHHRYERDPDGTHNMLSHVENNEICEIKLRDMYGVVAVCVCTEQNEIVVP
ncbi:hypothetical protein EAI_02856 [Harpegnathos saltator]|uniref:Uncharacterized protein n=1 Tax=Harpegnathos saltator TaxID=610380 RepID=E2C6S1_HARSA|nr:hypothetical protein EAI_02856 [Harpegnathos saltator]